MRRRTSRRRCGALSCRLAYEGPFERYRRKSGSCIGWSWDEVSLARARHLHSSAGAGERTSSSRLTPAGVGADRRKNGVRLPGTTATARKDDGRVVGTGDRVAQCSTAPRRGTSIVHRTRYAALRDALVFRVVETGSSPPARSGSRCRRKRTVEWTRPSTRADGDWLRNMGD